MDILNELNDFVESMETEQKINTMTVQAFLKKAPINISETTYKSSVETEVKEK